MKITKSLSTILILVLLCSLTYALPPEPSNDFLEKIQARVNDVLSIVSKPTIDVYGTEYQSGDTTTTFLQLLSSNNTPINNATCFVDIYYPSKTLFINSVLMTYLSGSNGIYYYDNIAQDEVGVYIIDAICEYLTTDLLVSATVLDVIEGTYISGTNSSLTAADNDRLVIDETFDLANFSRGVGTVLLSVPFDETSGNVSDDVSLFNNDGEYFGSPNLTIVGVQNTGILFDGTDDYVNFSYIDAYDLNSTEEIAVCFAYNSFSDNANGDPVVDHKNAAGIGWEIVGQDDELRFSTQRSGSGNKNHNTLFAFNDNNWHTVCFLATLTQMQSYVDGAFDRQSAQAQAGTMAPTSPIIVGADDVLSRFGLDAIDELCVIKGYNLNISSIALEYNSSYDCNGLFTDAVDEYVIDLEVSVNGLIGNETDEWFSIYTEYNYDSDEEQISVFIYNTTNNEWFRLQNNLIKSLSDVVISSTLDVSLSDFIDTNGTLRIKYNDTLRSDTEGDTLELDYVAFIATTFLSTPINSVRGGGEIHVTNYTEDLLIDITNTRNEVFGVLSENAGMWLVIAMLALGVVLLIIGKNMLAHIISMMGFLSAWLLLIQLNYDIFALLPFTLAFIALIKAMRLKTSDKKGESVYIE